MVAGRWHCLEGGPGVSPCGASTPPFFHEHRWKQIDRNESWQTGAYDTLAVSYLVIALVALVSIDGVHFQGTRMGQGPPTPHPMHMPAFTVHLPPLHPSKVQIVRIQLRVPEYGWTTQKVFHLLNFLVCGLRSAVFFFRGQVQRLPLVVVQAGLLDLPGLLFFSTYTLLVLFWAEIYYQARSLPTTALRPTFVIINLIVYGIQVRLECVLL